MIGIHGFDPAKMIKSLATHLGDRKDALYRLSYRTGAILAGVPAIVEPASASCYLTDACVRLMIESGVLTEGALHMVAGSTGGLLDLLDCQNTVCLTGSADTAYALRSSENLLRNSVRFVAEQDSLNASILGPDAAPGTAEFDLFIKESQGEMTTMAGPFHGRHYVNNRVSMKEANGHGSPLPHMVHGGPGRVGGEELGGIRGVKHYMQRSAVQGSPDILAAITNTWVPDGSEIANPAHPFTRRFGDLAIPSTPTWITRTIWSRSTSC